MDLTKVCINQGTVLTPWSDDVKWSDVMSKPDVCDWIRWVNVNICHKLKKDSFTTTDVKLRIATGMLNKIVSLSDKQKIRIHLNLTNNVHNEVWRLMDEILPF